MLSHFESLGQKTTFAALVLALVALLSIAVGSTARQVGEAWPGFVTWRNLVVPAIGGPDWPGNRAGIPLRSIVLAADGAPVSDALELRAAVRARPVGSAITYAFAHDGRRAEVVVRSAPLSWTDVLAVYLPYWIDGIAFFALGVIVFYFRPRLRAARAALALGTVLGGVLLLASDVLSSFWVDGLYFVLESATPAALLHFALCFPEEKAIVRRHRWLPWAVYAPVAPLAALQLRGLHGDPRAHLAINDAAYAAIALAGLVSVASLAHAFLASKSPLARQQAKIVLAGVVAAAFVPSLAILGIVVLDADMPMNLLAPFFLVYPLSIAYAIARHDLFSVDRFLRLGVVYAALSLIVFLSYAGLVVLGESLLGAGRSLPGGVIPAYVLAVLLVFDPLRAAIQRVVDRLFHRQTVSYRSTVEATSRVLASVLDTERVAATVLETLVDVMAIEWAVLAVLGPGDRDLRWFGRPDERRRSVEALTTADFARRLAARTAPVSRYDDAAGAPPASGETDATQLARLGGTLALPLRFERQPVGVLVVGDKKSGAFYSDEELQLLETLVHQCALAFTNAHAAEVLRRTQTELAEAERLAAVGELASAVAHGIRNPVAGIRAAAQVAREDVEPGAAVAESLDDIISETDRLERRIRGILDLARPGAAERLRGDPNAFIDAFAAARGPTLPGGVRLTVETDPSVPPVVFDPTQLAEALDVLVTNAVEAIGERGSIRVTCRREQSGRERAVVAIAVADSGPGIDAARRARLFELFYTTKPTGTGVGLALARRLVERQGGTLAAESESGTGATFVLRLPIDDGGVAAH